MGFPRLPKADFPSTTPLPISAGHLWSGNMESTHPEGIVAEDLPCLRTLAEKSGAAKT